MKQTIKLIFFLFLCVSCIYVLIEFRAVPKQQVWKDFIVLIVPLEVKNSTVIDLLNEESIENYLYIHSDKFEIQSMYAPVYNNEQQNNYDGLFYDSSYSYKLFYIPEKYVKNVVSIINKNKHLGLFVETNMSYPIIPLLFLIIFFVFLLCFSKDKFFYIQLLSPFILFVYCFPSYFSMFSGICVIFSVYIWQKIHRRKYEISVLLKKSPFVFLILLSFASIILNEPMQGMFFLVTFILSFSLFAFSDVIKTIKDSPKKEVFEPVLIINAKFINPFDRKTRLTFIPITFLLCISLILQFFLPANISSSKLLIPTPVDYTKEHDFSLNSYEDCLNKQIKVSDTVCLPNLIDYIENCWRVLTYPYNSINKKVDYQHVFPNDKIIINDYYEEDNKLKLQENIVYLFDNQFITDSLNLIKQTNKPLIENLLLEQDSFCSIIYKKIGKNNSTSTKIILFLLISFLLSLLISLNVVLRKYTGKDKKQDFYVTCN